MPAPDSLEDHRPPAIALMGPTASGKTALAVEWVGRFGGEIVSVDSALVYRGMDIGTAKPDAETLRRAPHRLIDLREPHQPYSAAEFAADALAAMGEIAAQGRVPLLAGGTGLYFRALLDGLSTMPAAEPALRAAIEAEAAVRGWAALHGELAAADPAAARRIGPTDPQRISRALEVWRVSGRPISDWQRQAVGGRRRFPFRVLRLALAPADREVLHRRVEMRFLQMRADGFLDEVRRLRADPRLHAELPAIRAVGYRQAWEHLDGCVDAATFRRKAIAATRQLAKRQLTWLRGELAVRWFDPEREAAAADRAVAAFLGAGSRAGR
jgi:tRNA dimethylallyltransferase